jgi:membrane protease YdiL (CAAX protease family)
MSFTRRFAAMLAVGVIAAVVLSPLVAVAVAAAGFHFPFPRIFDRTVMATLLAAILWNLRAFKLGDRLARGFAEPLANLPGALRGLLLATATMGTLLMLAAILEGPGGMTITGVVHRAPRYFPAAVLIAIIEEGFFRAFLLDGMKTDFGARRAVAASSVVYALAHLVRSPAHFYTVGLEPAAGARNLIAMLAQIADLHALLPAAIGLFLIGLVLGEAFVLTGTVYFSIGMHAGMITGLKSWPAIADRAALPQWLFGFGRFPLVSGAAAWLAAIVILVLLRPLARRK